jgi:IS1 family transposase
VSESSQKRAKKTGKQNFLCRSCGKQFQKQCQYAGCKLENKVLALKLLVRNSGIRAIETVLGVHRQTILRCLKQKADQCRLAPNQQHYGQEQIDELWTFVKQRKKQKRWLFYAYARETDEILAWSWGTRSRETVRKLYEQIQKLFIDCFCSNDWPAFQEVFPKGKHSIDKAFTKHIEGVNLCLRTRNGRVVRKTACFSKK